MISPIEYVARQLWYGMLWFMRRPRVKRFRHQFPKYLSESKRAEAWESFRKQERFARRYGLPIMRVVVGLCFAIIFIQVVAAIVLTLNEQGALRVPEPG